MKICLINTSYCLDKDIGYLPASLLSLGAILEKNGHTVQIVDLEELMRQKKLAIDRSFHDNAAKIIINKNIKILGFNTRCDTYPSVLNIAKRCKELVPSSTIIFGGPQATILDIETLENFKFVDIVVRGEGELTIVELANKLRNKEELQNVAGITYRECNGKIVRSPDRELIEDLDSLPRLAYHLLDGNANNESIFKNRWTAIEVGRGCPYSCIFCSTSLIHKRIFRIKSPERIVEEMEFLKRRYGIKYFSFLHDHLLFGRENIMKISEILMQRKLGVYWNCSSRPDYVTPQLLKIMVKAGCHGIYFGIESGSQRIQKSIQKNINVSIIPGIIEECEKYNMLITASFIVGFPDEREKDINATLGLALKCSLYSNCVVQLHLLAPMPRTSLFEKCKDRLIFTGLFSDVADSQIAMLKENLKLIKKYPSVFCIYYGIKPKYIPIELFYKVVNIYLVIFSVYRLSCRIVLEELKFKPMKLLQELYRNIRERFRWRGWIMPRERIKKAIPQIIDDIYEAKKAAPEFIKSIIRFEIKKYNESKQEFLKGKQIYAYHSLIKVGKEGCSKFGFLGNR